MDPEYYMTQQKVSKKYVDAALSCAQKSQADGPAMSDVVRKMKNILQTAGLNPNAESASTSASYKKPKKR